MPAKPVQVLNETTKQMTITMGNPNPLPVNYQWSFVEDAAPRFWRTLPKPSFSNAKIMVLRCGWVAVMDVVIDAVM